MLQRHAVLKHRQSRILKNIFNCHGKWKNIFDLCQFAINLQNKYLSFPVHQS